MCVCIYIYIFICVCVCVCVCKSNRDVGYMSGTEVVMYVSHQNDEYGAV